MRLVTKLVSDHKNLLLVSVKLKGITIRCDIVNRETSRSKRKIYIVAVSRHGADMIKYMKSVHERVLKVCNNQKISDASLKLHLMEEFREVGFNVEYISVDREISES